MTKRQHSVRLDPPIDQALRREAAARNIKPYRLLQIVVERGLHLMVTGKDEPQLAVEIGAIAAELQVVEELTKQTLRAATAAYVAAAAALGEAVNSPEFSMAVESKFEDQLRAAGGMK